MISERQGQVDNSLHVIMFSFSSCEFTSCDNVFILLHSCDNFDFKNDAKNYIEMIKVLGLLGFTCKIKIKIKIKF